MILKTVTLQEANGLLPLVRERFFRIHILLAQLQYLRTKLQKKQKIKFVFNKKCADILVIKKKIGKQRHTSLVKEIKNLEILAEDELSELMRCGVVIKSLFPPHIDFLSSKNNELIYLCWHGGEKEICHFHPLDDGPMLRQSIAQKTSFGPHVVH